MCTVSWLREADGYHIFFNRDELRSRKPASPPRVARQAGRSYLAPVDGDGGGTWVAVNDRGLTLGLLNGAAIGATDRRHAGDFVSRGLLASVLIGEPTPSDVARALQGMPLNDYRPFLLAVFAPQPPGLLARWDATVLRLDTLDDSAMPLVSSSFAGTAVRRARRDRFAHLFPRPSMRDVQSHLSYHASHVPEKGPFSTCMHRPDAQTVSFSWITVKADDVRFRYSPHAPCSGGPVEPGLRLER